MTDNHSNNLTKSSDLTAFLINHRVKKGDTEHPPTHARIGSSVHGISGGSYHIPEEELEEFYDLYHTRVFVQHKPEYLTALQLNNNGPIVIDLDFKYKSSITTRQHTKETILDFLEICLTNLLKCYVFNDGDVVPIYFSEKPKVNVLSDGTYTKDGIHMVIGIQSDGAVQTIHRSFILEDLSQIVLTEPGSVLEDPLHLPFAEGQTWEQIVDEGVSAGSVGWQVYGSRKPAHDPYKVTYMFTCTYDSTGTTFAVEETNLSTVSDRHLITMCSSRYTKCISAEIHPGIQTKYNGLKEKTKKRKRPRARTNVTLLSDSESDCGGDDAFIPLNCIVDKASLENAMQINVLSKLKQEEYFLQEIHEYTQILPAQYYEPGSHALNRSVAFALKHTSPKLFLSWVMLRSKADDFDYDSIPELYNTWKQRFNISDNGKVLTKRSIIYWAKQHAPEEYERVKMNTINHYIQISIYEGQTEFDIANVLYQMYKSTYICVSLQGKGLWYVFKHHRWEADKGLSLRKAVSTHLYTLYANQQLSILAELQEYDAGDERQDKCKKKAAFIGKLMIKLKKTADKNNIIREAMELFYDDKFITTVDTNRYLMGFKNGVVDFETKTFRDGYPQDYITKSTGINYIDYTSKRFGTAEKLIASKLIELMEQLFPNVNMNNYMWDHLASCTIGVIKNQTFNIYFGSGANGKSLLVDLMSAGFGEYKAIVPVSLVTDKQTAIGQSSSEIMKLKNIRYAVMQELSKNMKLNEGPMKAITSGDDMQGRSLYMDCETFKPQFNLVVCTNSMFEIDTVDDGTWRRLRQCVFEAKFVDPDDTNEYDTPHIFPKDKALSEQLPKMAPVFMSMLVKRVFETGGVVADCPEVIEATNKYRKTQDNISTFVSECIMKTQDASNRIGKTGVREAYKLWHNNEYGGKKVPKPSDIYEAMDKKFGSFKKNGWSYVAFVEDEDDEVDVKYL